MTAVRFEPENRTGTAVREPEPEPEKSVPVPVSVPIRFNEEPGGSNLDQNWRFWSGKGRMTDNLGHDDCAYHEYLQQQVYAEDLGLNFPHSHPSLRISEPDLNVTPILTSQSENMPDLGHDGDEHDDPDPNPHQDFDFYPQMEEKLPKQVKSDLFVLHMKKVTNEDGSTIVICNYCKKVFKWHKSGGYGSYRKYITNSHPDAQAKSSSQSQIPRYATPNQQLFKYSDAKNREELARIVAVEHLPFSFGEKVGFNNYCQRALNPAACRVPRTTLTEALENIYEKEKKMLEIFFEKYNGRVSVCADIWSDHWRMHSYIGVTCHYMDNAWAIQKRILAFRVFDEKHTAANIFRHLRIIFTEYKIENKIFAIGFDNASNNTAAIPALIELCKPYLGVFYTATNNLSGVYYPTTNLFIIESLNIAGAFVHCESDSELHESVTAMKDKWVKTLLYELYDEYIKVYGPSLNIDVPQTQNVSRSSSSSSSFVNLGYNLLSKKTKKLRGSSSSSSTTYSELESYLSTSFGFIEDTEDKKFDILHWWKEHERYFPILAMIAKQILSTPVSTVAVEQQFSAGGNILDPRRSLMSPKSLQIQACVEDLTKAQNRQQEIDQEEPYDFFKDDQQDESRTDDHGND
ncbi:hypothetical protein Dsin_028597 [Dipteronia sinensis]|uniref:HAT C-terminal dimerisation domain-containing protein n=1 Tax=Dipteronia sinensis TaxID=43782 RepID=A0AAD9ZSJ4_9ROSI|nr:hypothetical protein Dsin_028597 [Dipteronia sinensis]